MAQLDAQSIINFIGSAPKKTFVKVYVKGKNLDSLTYPEGVDAFVEYIEALKSYLVGKL